MDLFDLPDTSKGAVIIIGVLLAAFALFVAPSLLGGLLVALAIAILLFLLYHAGLAANRHLANWLGGT